MLLQVSVALLIRRRPGGCHVCFIVDLPLERSRSLGLSLQGEPCLRMSALLFLQGRNKSGISFAVGPEVLYFNGCLKVQAIWYGLERFSLGLDPKIGAEWAPQFIHVGSREIAAWGDSVDVWVGWKSCLSRGHFAGTRRWMEVPHKYVRSD
ncbi:hypothetical protein MPH_08975 [Macrophomina phaseolina MS6]|uniref:Uncharacterized protein n=1 Tax=Macrophomina phaseolina (strain MS6) TaxID=1126212 RepID=K2RGX1_MACPH|nr:hypothetical protein MPH_08975 [Macrophomina phaseolina MS6]